MNLRQVRPAEAAVQHARRLQRLEPAALRLPVHRRTLRGGAQEVQGRERSRGSPGGSKAQKNTCSVSHFFGIVNFSNQTGKKLIL